MTTRHQAAALTLATLAALTAGCATPSPSSTGPPTTTHTTPTTAVVEPLPNPVTYLQQLKGCTVDPNTVIGDVDITGGRYATCAYHNTQDGSDGTTVTARTFHGQPADNYPDIVGAAGDQTVLILKPGVMLEVTGPTTYATPIDVDAIAKAISGVVYQPQLATK